MKRLLFVFLAACSGSSGVVTSGNLPGDVPPAADAAPSNVDVGNTVGQNDVTPGTDTADAGELGDTATPDDAAPDAEVDAGECPQGCALPSVCGGSGAKGQCGSDCQTHDDWIATCDARSNINATWAAPSTCSFIYRVINGTTVAQRPNGLSGCVPVYTDAALPIYCCP